MLYRILTVRDIAFENVILFLIEPALIPLRRCVVVFFGHDKIFAFTVLLPGRHPFAG
jgi:hypothetical protein